MEINANSHNYCGTSLTHSVVYKVYFIWLAMNIDDWKLNFMLNYKLIGLLIQFESHKTTWS